MFELKEYRGHIRNWKALMQELGINGEDIPVNDGGIPERNAREKTILIKGFERWGKDIADHLYGMFAFAIYDNETLVYYNTFKTDKMKSTTARINEVKKWLMHIINEYEIDFLGLENI